MSALLSNSAAASLELQHFEKALLYSSTAAVMQVADEGLLSKADGSDGGGCFGMKVSVGFLKIQCSSDDHRSTL